MTSNTKTNAIVADRAILSVIQVCSGDGITVMDAESWLADIKGLTEGGQDRLTESLAYDVMAVAAMDGSAIAKDLQTMARKLHIPYGGFNKPGVEEVGKWIVDMTLARAQEAFMDAAEARKAAAILRRDLDRQQQAFHVLEGAVHDFGMPQYTLALDLPFTAETMVLFGAECKSNSVQASIASKGSLSQRLPLSARRISCVDLHCQIVKECSGNGKLEVSIRDLAGEILARSESMDLIQISPGWNRFDFPMGIDCTDRDAVLHVSLTGNAAVELSHAPATPIERFHPRRKDDTPIFTSPLAVKVWRGLCGVRNQIPFPAVSTGGFMRRRSGDMPKARLYNIVGDPLDFDPVQYWAKEDGFLVHPPAGGMTVGMIEGLDLQNFSSVTAIVNNGHREASPLSFSIGIVPSNQFFHVPSILGPWLTLPPLGWGEVHAALPKPTSGKFDLLLATMVSKEHGNHMAWGLFRGFLLNADAV